VFTVLLRLRRLQQALSRQWAPLNSRPGKSTGSRSSSSRRSSSSSSSSSAPRPQQQQQHEDATGLGRLQQLRQWHALARTAVDGLLGHMLGQLCGPLRLEFEGAVSGSGPVSLPAMVAAHEALLCAARRVCLLPAPTAQPATAEEPSAGSGGNSLAGLIHQVVDCSWQLQAQVAALLQAVAEHQTQPKQQPQEQPERTLRTGFREGHDACRLARVLATDDGVWPGVAGTGQVLQAMLWRVQRQLAVAQVASNHPLAGLAARLLVPSDLPVASV
jgi:hypothetical protein